MVSSVRSTIRASVPCQTSVLSPIVHLLWLSHRAYPHSYWNAIGDMTRSLSSFLQLDPYGSQLVSSNPDACSNLRPIFFSVGWRDVPGGACCRMQTVAAFEAGLGVDATGSTRRGRLSAEVRALPLSHDDAWIEWPGPAGAHQGAGNALRCAAYR